MRSFFRSLNYLKPYKLRLGISIVCVVFIAVLWGGGLGMLLPGMKILIDPEGLHGWAWLSGTEGRLGAKVVKRIMPAQVLIEDQQLPLVLDVVNVDEKGPAARAGIRANEWIVGAQRTRLVRGDILARFLATTQAEKTITLHVFNQYSGKTRQVQLVPDRLDFKSRMLVKVATAIPEPQRYRDRLPLFLWLLAIGLAITVVRDLFRFLQEYFVQTAAQRAMVGLRCDNYNVALRLPVTFYSARGTTDTMSRFVQDTHEIRRGQVALFGKTLVEPAKALGSIAVALFFSWKLTLIAMVAGPPVVVLITRFGRVMRRASRRALESWSRMLAVLEETLTGIRVVKAYTMESTERKRFYRVNRRLLKEQDRISRVDAVTPPTVEALGITAALVAAGIAGYFVLNRQMDPHVFVAWMGCLIAMFDPMRKLAQVPNRFQRADAAATRVFELHDREQEKRPAKAPLLAPHKESIEFRNVSFRYPEASADALKDINLQVPGGQTLAIVGPNGSGKTTLVSLLPKLLEPTAGAVLIDGQDISKVSLRSLRRQIAVVTQDTVLFNATVAENIAYGLRRASQRAVLAAAKKAFVDEFVRDLPEGYDTTVGEHGATLSGGQKQRITIARAIIRDPRILIFDEAMSQIDADSERKIHQAMEQFIKDRTTLMIAHRFATVLSADRLAVMDAGRIVDTGTHKELLERCDVYRHLYKTQFADTGGVES
ncbi:MAG: ABC transporter ATP-binding protein [Planctomycetota bacterium]|jgi:ABC-type multidrug transport system fused ATPase/permease subunit